MARPKVPRIKRKCGVCLCVFMAIASEVSRGGGKYCSQKCYVKSRIGVPCPEDRKLKISISNKKAKRDILRGEKSPTWKGGFPNCKTCDVKLSRRKPKTFLCEHCATGPANWRWKGGRLETNRHHIKKYRARKAGAEGSHTNEQWESLKKKFNYMCLCCKQQEPFIKLSADHIVPLSIGGSNYIQNIQPLCISCNSRKGTNTMNFIELVEVAYE